MEKWTYEDTVIAFWAYTRIPFKNSSKTHPEVVRIAQIIGRTPSALNMKIGNLGRLDPSLADKGITGLTHGAKMEVVVWKDFVDNPERLATEIPKILAQYSGKNIEQTIDIDLENLPEGKDRETVVKQRIGQSFFRTAVLTSYNNRCCISGVSNNGLLEACHIADWAEAKEQRTNPCNGLCMNPFFHKAYDKYLLGISPDFEIIASDALIQGTDDADFKYYLNTLNGKKITMPERFMPNKELLALHYEEFRRVV